MRHQVGDKKLNRDSDHRRSLIKNQVRQLLSHGTLTTTETKAGVIKSQTEKLITKAKDGSVHIRRQLTTVLGDRELTQKAVDEIAKHYADKTGGFIKSVRLGRRRGDNTMMVRLEMEKYQTPETEKIEDKKKQDKKAKPAKKSEKVTKSKKAEK